MDIFEFHENKKETSLEFFKIFVKITLFFLHQTQFLLDGEDICSNIFCACTYFPVGSNMQWVLHRQLKHMYIQCTNTGFLYPCLKIVRYRWDYCRLKLINSCRMSVKCIRLYDIININALCWYWLNLYLQYLTYSTYRSDDHMMKDTQFKYTIGTKQRHTENIIK